MIFSKEDELERIIQEEKLAGQVWRVSYGYTDQDYEDLLELNPKTREIHLGPDPTRPAGRVTLASIA